MGDISKAGLDYLHNTMVFVRDGQEVPLAKAMSTLTDKKFLTHEIQGGAPRAEKYTVHYKGPYGTPGRLKELSGDALHNQLDSWVRKGTIEVSTASSIGKVIDNPEWCDLRDLYIVLFGATSAMGPFYKLMD